LNLQSYVEDFHRKFGHPVRTEPQTIDEGEALLAFRMIEEELMELDDALWKSDECICGETGCNTFSQSYYAPDLVEIADALGDIVWLALGMASRHGIDMNRVMTEIARSNDSKLGLDGKPIYITEGPKAGKIGKGPNYTPPNLKAALGI
jgi:predicted HAD superfamily Cof-like phosphohydrolase